MLEPEPEAHVETAEETPTVDETTVDETIVDETTVDETIVDETTVDETIVDETIVDAVSESVDDIAAALDEADRVIAEAAATQAEAATEMSAPRVRLNDIEDRGRLARALRTLDSPTPPPAVVVSESTYAGNVVKKTTNIVEDRGEDVKRVPEKAKPKKRGGFHLFAETETESDSVDDSVDESDVAEVEAREEPPADEPVDDSETVAHADTDTEPEPAAEVVVASVAPAKVSAKSPESPPSFSSPGKDVVDYVASSAWSPPSSPDAATVDVNTLVFNVVSHLTVGESLIVVGNVAELGGWNVDVGAKMTWTEGDVWTAEVAIPTDSAAVEFKMVRFNEGSGVTTWQEGDNYRAEMRSGQTVRVDTPNAFVQSLEVRIVADRVPAEPKTPEVAAAAAAVDADEATESAAKEPYRFVDVPYEEEMQILAPVTYRFEDVPVDEIDAAITAAPVPAEDVEAVEKLVVAETKSEEEIAVVAAMQSARKAFDEAAETARAASEKSARGHRRTQRGAGGG